MLLDRVVGPVREARIHAEGKVGGADHLLHEEVERARQALPAVGGIAAERGPAALAEGVVGLSETLRRAHHAILEGAALLVAAAIERQQHLLAKLRALLEHGFEEIRRRLLVARKLAELSHV